MNLFISDKIREYVAATKYRYHTPGHKGTLLKEDITEIDDAFPSDAIKRAQRETAALLKSRHCRFLVGGSSMGIKANVLACGGDILVAENSHRALFEAAKLAKVNAFTVKNEYRYGLPMSPDARAIEAGLNAHSSVKAVYITSPDYYGFTAKGEIAEVAKDKGVYLFCDAAHGAHFPFCEELFPRSFSTFAHSTNLSAHKTLAAYTQTAYLAVNDDELMQKIDDALDLLGTTSPSYVLLGGLEYAAKHAQANAKKYFELKLKVDELKKSVPTLSNDDFSRIVVDAAAMGLSGKELYFKLKGDGYVAEKYDENYVVFIVTLCDEPQAIEKLKDELCAVNSLR